MNMNKNTSSGSMVLGILALSFALHAHAKTEAPNNAQSKMNPFCITGDVPQETKDLCSKIVGGAKTWEEAALASWKRVTEESKKSMKPVLGSIEAKLDKKLPLSDRTQIAQICKKNYEAALEGLHECPNLITVGPFSSYETTLTSVYTSIEDCKDAIAEEKGQAEIIEVTNLTKEIQKLIDVALIISKKDPRIADYNKKLANGEFKDSAGDPSLIGPITTTSYGAHP